LKKLIVEDYNPENVILLEIKPEEQKTRIDFAATEKILGIKAVDISAVKRVKDKLFYNNGNADIPIHKIYNRVILDEIERKNIEYDFNFYDELDVKWCGHPNWFLRISKISLPLLKGKYVPQCYFLNELVELSDDFSQFVLNPLFSFAGHGVEVDLKKELLENISDKKNYILQQKIDYAPLSETPDEYSKVEIRMMFLWEKNKKPLLVNNLISMSKGKMMGVDFNKNKTWVLLSVDYDANDYCLHDFSNKCHLTSKKSPALLQIFNFIAFCKDFHILCKNFPNWLPNPLSMFVFDLFHF